MDKMMPVALVPVYKKGKLKSIVSKEFVQCKDCKHGEKSVAFKGCISCNIHNDIFVKDYFCGHGKREEQTDG